MMTWRCGRSSLSGGCRPGSAARHRWRSACRSGNARAAADRAGRLAGGFPAGDLLSVRLRDGALEISARKLPEEEAAGSRCLRDVCAFAAVEALKRYAGETAGHPFAPLHEILIELLLTEPKIFASPMPPLARTLRAAGLETFGGSGRGSPWNLARIRGLGRAGAVAGPVAGRPLLGRVGAGPRPGARRGGGRGGHDGARPAADVDRRRPRARAVAAARLSDGHARGGRLRRG